jgi:hypothetical protein
MQAVSKQRLVKYFLSEMNMRTTIEQLCFDVVRAEEFFDDN